MLTHDAPRPRHEPTITAWQKNVSWLRSLHPPGGSTGGKVDRIVDNLSGHRTRNRQTARSHSQVTTRRPALGMRYGECENTGHASQTKGSSIGDRAPRERGSLLMPNVPNLPSTLAKESRFYFNYTSAGHIYYTSAEHISANVIKARLAHGG